MAAHPEPPDIDSSDGSAAAPLEHGILIQNGNPTTRNTANDEMAMLGATEQSYDSTPIDSRSVTPTQKFHALRQFQLGAFVCKKHLFAHRCFANVCCLTSASAPVSVIHSSVPSNAPSIQSSPRPRAKTVSVPDKEYALVWLHARPCIGWSQSRCPAADWQRTKLPSFLQGQLPDTAVATDEEAIDVTPNPDHTVTPLQVMLGSDAPGSVDV